MKKVFLICFLLSFLFSCWNVKMYSLKPEHKGFYDSNSFYYWVQLYEDNPYDEDLTLDRLRITFYEAKKSSFKLDTVFFTPIFEKTNDTLDYSKIEKKEDYFYKPKTGKSIKKMWKQNKYLKLDVNYKLKGDTSFYHRELILKKSNHWKSFIIHPHG